jgi:hypothetical protein
MPFHAFSHFLTDGKADSIDPGLVGAVVENNISGNKCLSAAINPFKFPAFFQSSQSHPDQALSFFLSFCRLLLITERPAFVLILVRKPWFLFLFLFFG